MPREVAVGTLVVITLAGVFIAVLLTPLGYGLVALGAIGLAGAWLIDRQALHDDGAAATAQPEAAPSGHELEPDTLRRRMHEEGPSTPEAYIQAYAELTWASDMHRVDRLVAILADDMGIVPEDLEDRVYTHGRQILAARGALAHIRGVAVSRQRHPLAWAERHGASREQPAFRALARLLAATVPGMDARPPVAYMAWLIEQETDRLQDKSTGQQHAGELEVTVLDPWRAPNGGDAGRDPEASF